MPSRTEQDTQLRDSRVVETSSLAAREVRPRHVEAPCRSTSNHDSSRHSFVPIWEVWQDHVSSPGASW